MFEMIPFRKHNSLAKGSDYFDQFFSNFFNDDFLAPMNFAGNAFKVDLKETDNDYTIEADLPGIKKEDINIDYSNNYLTISAKKDEFTEDTTNEKYVRRERHFGEFKRAFYIDNVDENSIDASFTDGVLKLTLPKQNKGNNPKRRIDIH